MGVVWRSASTEFEGEFNYLIYLQQYTIRNIEIKIKDQNINGIKLRVSKFQK